MFYLFYNLQGHTLKTFQQPAVQHSVRTYSSASKKLLSDLCRSHIKVPLRSRPHVLFTADVHVCVCMHVLNECVCCTFYIRLITGTLDYYAEPQRDSRKVKLDPCRRVRAHLTGFCKDVDAEWNHFITHTHTHTQDLYYHLHTLT